VVVAIRGTMSAPDWVTDGVAIPVAPWGWRDDLPAAEVHEGMMRAAENLLRSVAEPVRTALKDHPGSDLVVTGHSLGAGTAILLTVLMRTSGDPALQGATCVAYGPPPVLRGPALQGCEDYIETVVNGDDIVARLTIPSMVYLLQTANHAHFLPWWKQALLTLRWDCCVDIDKVVLTPSSAEDETRRLYIPGVVYQLTGSEDGDGAMRLCRITPTQLFHVVSSDRMLLDHLPWSYHTRLTEVCRSHSGQPPRACHC
jgi:hypothetical protein